MPGLLSYAAYRAARLWLPAPGAIAAGGFFGLSGMLTWRSWYHLNLAAGAVFLPLALASAVRLRRQPTGRRAMALGLTLAASLLTDQESAVLAVILALLVLLPWLAHRAVLAKTRTVALATAAAALAGAPQLAAVAWQAASGGAPVGGPLLTASYTRYGTPLTGLFAPSPRLADLGLTSLATSYYHNDVIHQTIAGRYLPVSEPTPMFGLVLTILAVLGLLISWRRPAASLLALLWLGAAALALGPVLWIGTQAYTPAAMTVNGTRLSALLPYTWFVQLPGLSGFREAGRLAELGLLPAALLAGATVQWLREHAAPALVLIAAAALLDAGWPGNLPAGMMPAAYQIGVMPTTMPRSMPRSQPVARDQS